MPSAPDNNLHFSSCYPPIRRRAVALTIMLVSLCACSKDSEKDTAEKFIGHHQVAGEALNIKDIRDDAESGNVGAQVLMGEILLYGSEGPQYAEAAVWLRRAADAGSSAAQVDLALLAIDGNGVPKNKAKAIELLRSAAKRKNPRAHMMLGFAAAEGDGMPKDNIAAQRYFSFAIEHTDEVRVLAPAFTGMAMINNKVNSIEAAKWARQAAELGAPMGMELIADYYRRGIGVPQNSEQAYFWFSLAASADTSPSNASKFRDALAEKLSQDRLTAVQDQAGAWRPAKSAAEARERLNARH